MPHREPVAPPRIVLGIAGGSGSGKSELSHHIEAAFPGLTARICHDWYYEDNGGLPPEMASRINFDHPDALETGLMCRQLDALSRGRSVDAPLYDYATHSRLSRTRRIEPRPLIIVDGILILQDRRVRDRLTMSVFIEVPADVRLLRRVRRDCRERHVELEETLRLYEDFVRPMHERFVGPSSRHAGMTWDQLTDAHFPARLIENLRKKLAAKRDAPTRRNV